MRFVIDNWYLMNIAFKDKKQVKYIITAFKSAEDDQESELLNQLKESINGINSLIKENHNKSV